MRPADRVTVDAASRRVSDTGMKRTLATIFLCLTLATLVWAGFNQGVATTLLVMP